MYFYLCLLFTLHPRVIYVTTPHKGVNGDLDFEPELITWSLSRKPSLSIDETQFPKLTLFLSILMSLLAYKGLAPDSVPLSIYKYLSNLMLVNSFLIFTLRLLLSLILYGTVIHTCYCYFL